MKIFGVPIDNISRKHFLHYLHDSMVEAHFHRVVTVNPEFLLLAQEEPRFKENLLRADLRLADGVGIAWVFGLHGETLEERLPGADLLRSVLTLAAAHHYPVYLAVRKNGLSSLEEIKTAIEKRFGEIKLEGQEFDTTLESPSLPETNAKILLSNFGAPAQEYFIQKSGETHSTLCLGMGVGGAFDFLTGKVTRAPEWMQFLGLEWLWRLKEQPHRFPRILRAVFLFPWRVLHER